MENLSTWLERLGLERYESVFAANEVDFDVLRMLSEKDLQDLGLSLGHRKKLLKAIADLDAPAAGAGLAIAAGAGDHRRAARQGAAGPGCAFDDGAHRLLGVSLFHSGDCRRGRSHMEQSVALYDFDKHHKLAAVYGQDPGVGSLAILSWILLPLGLPDQALAQARKAVQISRNLGHSHSLAYALHYASVVHIERGEYEEAQRQAQAAIALATEHGFPVWLSLSRALRHAGRVDEAREAINVALALVAQYGERRQEADMLRVKAELALTSPALDRDESHALLRRAVEAAREQGTLMWALRATAALARELRNAGSREELQALLTPEYGAFGEGFATRDLAIARALLEQLDAQALPD